MRWIDAETGERRPMHVDRATRASYEALLSRRLEAFGAAAARHGAVFGFWTSARPFEEIVTALFEG